MIAPLPWLLEPTYAQGTEVGQIDGRGFLKQGTNVKINTDGSTTISEEFMVPAGISWHQSVFGGRVALIPVSRRRPWSAEAVKGNKENPYRR